MRSLINTLLDQDIYVQPCRQSRCMLALVIYAVHLVRKSSISYITGRRDAT